MMTDPIADMLTRIRNAQRARHAAVTLTFSNLKMKLSSLLVQEGYVEKAEEVAAEPGTFKTILLTLKYFGKEPCIQNIVRESKPGHRRYCKAEDMPRVQNDYGIAIVSTSKGLMTNKQARKLKIGGEVICSIY